MTDGIERAVITCHHSPEALRAAIAAECSGAVTKLVQHVDEVLMGGEDILCVILTFTLPGGVQVRFTGELEQMP